MRGSELPFFCLFSNSPESIRVRRYESLSSHWVQVFFRVMPLFIFGLGYRQKENENKDNKLFPISNKEAEIRKDKILFRYKSVVIFPLISFPLSWYFRQTLSPWTSPLLPPTFACKTFMHLNSRSHIQVQYFSHVSGPPRIRDYWHVKKSSVFIPWGAGSGSGVGFKA